MTARWQDQCGSAGFFFFWYAYAHTATQSLTHTQASSPLEYSPIKSPFPTATQYSASDLWSVLVVLFFFSHLLVRVWLCVCVCECGKSAPLSLSVSHCIFFSTSKSNRPEKHEDLAWPWFDSSTRRSSCVFDCSTCWYRVIRRNCVASCVSLSVFSGRLDL